MIREYIEGPLYRYRKVDTEMDYQHVLDEILTGKIHLSNPDFFNDPFDASVQYDFNKNNRRSFYIETLGAYAQMTFNSKLFNSIDFAVFPDEKIHLEDFITEISKQTGVSKGELYDLIYPKIPYITPRTNNKIAIASFSERRDSIPMWAYYASDHSGVCLKYDFSLLQGNEKEQIIDSLHKVQYSIYRPKDSIQYYSPVVKSIEWSHELEWRIICEDNQQFITIDCLTQVYIGIRFPADRLKRLIDILKQKNRSIRLFTCWDDPIEYKLQFKELMYEDML